MMKLILFTIFLSVVSAGFVENLFNKAVAQIRPTLKDIQIDSITIQNLELKNLAIQGLDQFYTSTLSVKSIPLKVKNLTINVDHVFATSDYKMDSLTIPNLMTVSGEGDIRVNIEGITLYTKATLSVKSQIISIKELEEIGFHLEDFQIKITGLADNGPVCKFLNDLFNLVGTKLINIIATPLLMQNRTLLIPYINEMLEKIVI